MTTTNATFYVLIAMLVFAVIPLALADTNTTSDASVVVPATGTDSTPVVDTTTDNVTDNASAPIIIANTQDNGVTDNTATAQSTQIDTNQTSVPTTQTVNTAQHPRTVQVEQSNGDDNSADNSDATSIAEPMGPTISFQTAQSDVTVDNDAIIAGYVSNPALNDQDMHVIVSAHVPTNILIHSSDNILMGGAGLVEGTYTLSPNQNAVIDVHAIGSKVGPYVTTFNVMYWFGKDKKHFKTINLDDSFVVKEPSTNFHMDQHSANNNNTQKQQTDNGGSIGGITFTQLEMILAGGFVLIGIVIALRR